VVLFLNPLHLSVPDSNVQTRRSERLRLTCSISHLFSHDWLSFICLLAGNSYFAHTPLLLAWLDHGRQRGPFAVVYVNKFAEEDAIVLDNIQIVFGDLKELSALLIRVVLVHFLRSNFCLLRADHRSAIARLCSSSNLLKLLLVEAHLATGAI
jgi:hypothetical protein